MLLLAEVEYFKKKYGENPRSDILGIDGCALFVLIYIVAPEPQLAGAVDVSQISLVRRAAREVCQVVCSKSL